MEAFDRGVMDADTYAIWLSAVVAYVSTPGGSVWWKIGQFGFTPDVRQRVNEAAEGKTSEEFKIVVDQMLSSNIEA